MGKRAYRFLMSKGGYIAASVVGSASVANAALTFPTIELNDVTTIAAGMLALLGAVWALRKALGFLSGR